AYLTSPTTQPFLHSFPTRRSSDLNNIIVTIKSCLYYVYHFRYLLIRGFCKALYNILTSGKTTPQSLNLLFCFFCKYFSSMNTIRSEEHTSELQSRFDLVCRLLLEK